MNKKTENEIFYLVTTIKGKKDSNLKHRIKLIGKLGLKEELLVKNNINKR